MQRFGCWAAHRGMGKPILMKRGLLWLILVIGAGGVVQAQRGANAVKVLAEAGFPSKDFNPGGGGYVKFLYGVGRSGQVGLTTGFSRFREKASAVGGDLDPTRLTTLPVLLGYRHHIGSFYLEPQAGYGALNGRIDIGGDWARPSVGAFYWSAGTGYVHRRLDVGVRYQSAHSAEGSDAGTWHNKTFSFIGIHAGLALWQKAR